MDSEGLLAMPALQQVEGRQVHLVCGNGGRELLQDTLAQRGAHVSRIEVYRRLVPERRAAVANLVNGWSMLVDVVVATSNAILDNLLTMLGPEAAGRVQRTPLVVVSERMAAHAADLGCETVRVADSAGEQDLLRCLCGLERELAGGRLGSPEF